MPQKAFTEKIALTRFISLKYSLGTTLLSLFLLLLIMSSHRPFTYVAVMREVSESINRCELTHLGREKIDVEKAVGQHERYQECLRGMGVEVEVLPAMGEYPDAVFVEDVAIVLDEVAILTRPGAESRRGEVEGVRESLKHYRPHMAFMAAPATLDGGDVLVLDKHIFVGLSSRSNLAAVHQMQDILSPFSYSVVPIPIADCLHLKSAVTRASHDTLLLNPLWIDRNIFSGWKIVEVDPEEPGAANILYFEGGSIFPSEYPKTRERLERAGIRNLHTVPAGELAKAEGAVTCCSLIFKVFSK
jgi:dimethylargininase